MNPKYARGEKIFISHAHVDHYAVLAHIVAPLFNLGVGVDEVFYASKSVLPGEEWNKSIRSSLIQSQWLIVAISRASSKSEWVRKEVATWLERRKTGLFRKCETHNVIPIRFDDTDGSKIHNLLPSIQTSDGRGLFAGAEAIRQVFDTGVVPPILDRPNYCPQCGQQRVRRGMAPIRINEVHECMVCYYKFSEPWFFPGKCWSCKKKRYKGTYCTFCGALPDPDNEYDLRWKRPKSPK